jgi:hypothetical protein
MCNFQYTVKSYKIGNVTPIEQSQKTWQHLDMVIIIKVVIKIIYKILKYQLVHIYYYW